MKDLITEARELCEKATPGPWEANWLDDCFIEPRICMIPANGCYDYDKFEANSEFIARSRTLIPSLCDALEEEQKQNKQLLQELCKLACESVEREKTLARIEAEVVARLEERHEID